MRSLIFSVIMLMAAPTYAAEFFILPGTKTLLMMGETQAEDVQILRANIEDNDINALILKGPGGSLKAGYALANIVLENKLTITIPKDTDCASACSLIFVSGDNRIMEKGSRLGFHLPFVKLNSQSVYDYCASIIPLKAPVSSQDDKFDPAGAMQRIKAGQDLSGCLMRTYQQGLKDVRKLSKILMRDGISEDVLDLMINTPSDKIAWISTFYAKKYGLVTNQGN